VPPSREGTEGSNPVSSASESNQDRAATSDFAGNPRPADPARYGQNDRTITITRKIFLFLGSEAGGERAAILYTVLETAKLNGLDPEAYLADVINRMASRHPINRLGELLPWNWRHQPAKLAA